MRKHKNRRSAEELAHADAEARSCKAHPRFTTASRASHRPGPTSGRGHHSRIPRAGVLSECAGARIGGHISELEPGRRRGHQRTILSASSASSGARGGSGEYSRVNGACYGAFNRDCDCLHVERFVRSLSRTGFRVHGLSERRPRAFHHFICYVVSRSTVSRS